MLEFISNKNIFVPILPLHTIISKINYYSIFYYKEKEGENNLLLFKIALSCASRFEDKFGSLWLYFTLQFPHVAYSWPSYSSSDPPVDPLVASLLAFATTI